MNLTDILAHHAAHHGDELALEFDGRETSWSDLLTRTQAVAGALRVKVPKPPAAESASS